MPLPDFVTLVAGVNRTTGITSQSIASGTNFIGSTIDNAANLDAILDLEIIWQYATAPTANKSVRIYLRYALDGVNFETANTTDEPVWLAQVAGFSPPANTNQYRIVRGDIPLLPYPFQIVVRNHDTTQPITVTVNAVTRKDAQVID
ncbi:MAG: hypothetical protein KatS3mg038_3817 [Candidatus Kapaibacterium sp.]|nr:MAG: hypothetical protein KatS3mg038_3318 [Candidatus Kapabacteria bacterium]GIV53296.1 MAG: hypothetical protein KatS3mg038_3817 [Candidatus Kapabacteria bacterium]